ncbi:hypothetical protein EVAR_51143_1 [Eumeta japonica]|uniref:Uncharacterized protein n=1 Tax=Eumeta variegata TaxID=151549 RepID=A0A4C1YKK8_EUMVA|nr:hypothetical protein EVAR_51143_1 [Eumeta japonica]
MRMELSICPPRYRILVCHSTSCPRSLSFGGIVRCWPVRRAAVFVTFTATRHLSSQSSSRSRTLWSLAAARSARRNDAEIHALAFVRGSSTLMITGAGGYIDDSVIPVPSPSHQRARSRHRACANRQVEGAPGLMSGTRRGRRGGEATAQAAHAADCRPSDVNGPPTAGQGNTHRYPLRVDLTERAANR